MIMVSFFCHTIYNANKYQYNLHNFDFLNLRPYFLNSIFFKFNILCTFQFPMCTNFITCVHAHNMHSLQETLLRSPFFSEIAQHHWVIGAQCCQSAKWSFLDVNLSKIRPLCSLLTSVTYHPAIKHHVFICQKYPSNTTIIVEAIL